MTKTKVAFDSDKLNYASDLMRALAHPLRLQILSFIDSCGSSNVNKIYRNLEIEQSITSQHLKVLRLVGIVQSQKEGKYVHYTLNYETLKKASAAVGKFISAEKRMLSQAS